VRNRVTLDAFSGTRAELLALLRDLHNGTQSVDGLTRLQALDVVCDVLSDPRADRTDVVLAGRVTGALVAAIVDGVA